ncbi:MAG: HD family phosphohydrolase [Clostridium sp.]
MFYRVKQFFMAVFSKLDNDDKDFINRYLDRVDLEIFEKLPTHEKKHCINVARYVLDNNSGVGDFVIRASLLHDIGKVSSGLNPIFKGIIVIMNRISNKGTRSLRFIKPIRVYYNHPEIGGKIYSNIDSSIAYIIENHHNYNIKDSTIRMIQEADSNN